MPYRYRQTNRRYGADAGDLRICAPCPGHDRQQQALSRRLAAVYRETTRLNRKAAGLARRAARLCSDPHAAADLVWMAMLLYAASLLAAQGALATDASRPRGAVRAPANSV